MFTGIIEALGTVKNITEKGTNKTFSIEATLASELKINDSLSHNGVCLTIEKTDGIIYEATAVQETLNKTNLGSIQVGEIVNLERAMASGFRFDGHIVQGHVDQIGKCIAIKEVDGSWLIDFTFDDSKGNYMVEKGSVCIDGVSLTVFNVTDNSFRVTIIPHTMQATNFQNMKAGTVVNLEFDVVGKYIKRLFDMGYKDAIANR